MEHFEAIVLGTGGVGSAAAYHLARRGIRTLALDRFPPGHDRGSSHGETRVIRQAYFEHPDYVPLLVAAYRLWQELQTDTQQKLLFQVGLLQAGPPDGEVIPGVQQAAELHGLAIENLDHAEMKRRFGMFHVPESLCGVFEPQAGYLLAEHAILAHCAEAERLGAQLRDGAEVRSWRAVGDGVEVLTNQGSFAADRLIIAGGAWAASLLPSLKLPLQVLRKHLYWFQPAEPSYHEKAGCPTFLFELPDGVFYGFPQRNPAGVKISEHSGGKPVDDPLSDPKRHDPLDESRVQSFRKLCLPGVGSTVQQQAACFYTMTPDGHFIIDQHPEHKQVAYVAGLSGHGFKFTAVLGEILADLAIDGKTKHPIEFLSSARFTNGSLRAG